MVSLKVSLLESLEDDFPDLFPRDMQLKHKREKWRPHVPTDPNAAKALMGDAGEVDDDLDFKLMSNDEKSNIKNAKLRRKAAAGRQSSKEHDPGNTNIEGMPGATRDRWREFDDVLKQNFGDEDEKEQTADTHISSPPIPKPRRINQLAIKR